MSLPVLNLGAGWEWVINATPGRFTPKKEISYRFYSRLDGPQGRSGRMWWRENLDRSQNEVSCRQNICYLIFEIALYNSMECGLTGNDRCLDQALSQCYRSLITAFKLDLCNEKVATNHQSTFRDIHIHRIRTTFEGTWNMGRFYYFTVLNLWLVFRAHGSSALPSLTVNHCETWQWKGDKTAESRFWHVRQFIPSEKLKKPS